MVACMGVKGKWLLIGVGIKALLMGFLIAFGPLDLVPDEAQYWVWSRHLDWGYYSKPPGIAWLIAITTAWMGATPLGVRLGALLVGAALPVATYGLARRVGLSDGRATWAGAVMALCPAGWFASLLTTTDGPFTLCWVLATCALPYWPLVGLWVGVGALFKWPIFFFWPLAFLLVREKNGRTFGQGVAISLIGLLPSLIWNSQHGFATFLHVGTTMAGGGGVSPPPNPAAFLAAQAGLLSPVVFLLFLKGAWDHVGEPEERLRFIARGGLLLLVCYGLLSFRQKMQGNWVAFIVPWGCVLAATASPRWLRAGILSCAVLVGGGVASLFFLPKNPLEQALGWRSMTVALKEEGYRPDRHFLASNKYQEVSELSFYAEGQRRAYFLNLHGARRNQFDYWPSLQEEGKGQEGFFLWVDGARHDARGEEFRERLSPYFEAVEFRGWVPLSPSGKMAGLMFCRGYNGAHPELSSAY